MSAIEWKDSPTLPGARRGRQLVAGYDCGPDGRDCKHEPKGNHGQHCDDWIFVIAAPGFAVSLEVFSGEYPRGPLGVPEMDRPLAASVVKHSPSQLYDFAPDPSAKHCGFIDGPCWSDAGSLMARDFYELHGHGTFDETESFWLALEGLFSEIARPKTEKTKK